VHKLSLSLASAFIYMLLASTGVVQAEKDINTYGPTNKGDLLWNIAIQIAPPSISRYKVILALQKANPHAFRFSCNMASLKIDEILRIPTLLEMQMINETEAVKEVNRQQKEWKNRHNKPIVCPPVETRKPAIASTTETTTDTSKFVTEILSTEIKDTDKLPDKTKILTEVKLPVPPPNSHIPPTSDILIKTDQLNSNTVQEESVDNTQHVTLVSDEKADYANKAAYKDILISFKNFFQMMSSSTMIISLIAICGLLIILIAAFLHKYAKDKSNENDIPEEYNFHEPIDEMPYYKNANQ
jgi:pilus assembly protein FimV